MTAGRDSFPRGGNYRTGREGVKPVALAPIVDGLSHRWRFGDKSVGTGNSGDERRRSRSNWFAGDGRRFEQILTNLVENAIKLNRKNGTVKISYRKRSRS